MISRSGQIVILSTLFVKIKSKLYWDVCNGFFLYHNTGKSAHLWRCRYYDEYVECVGVPVKSVCGGDASTWQKTYANKLHQPALTYIGCSGSLTFSRFGLVPALFTWEIWGERLGG